MNIEVSQHDLMLFNYVYAVKLSVRGTGVDCPFDSRLKITGKYLIFDLELILHLQEWLSLATE